MSNELDPHDGGIGVENIGTDAEKNNEDVVQISDGEEKERNSRSDIWEHFVKIKENGVLKKGKCKYCHRLIAADTNRNGTSAMRRHFNSCKRNPHKFNKDPKQGTLQATNGQGISTWKYDPEALRQAFAEMVIEDELLYLARSQASKSLCL